MSKRSGLVLAAVAVLAAAAVGFASRRAAADSAPHRIVYLFVSGTGAQTKVWYDGAPPAGTLVQSALDRFASDGFKFSAIVSSGRTPLSLGTGAVAPRGDELAADYVIVLER